MFSCKFCKLFSGQLIRILLTITTRQKWNLLAVPSENDLESDFLSNIFVEMSKNILNEGHRKMLFMIASNLMLAKFPRKVAIYLVKVNNWNTRTKCEIYSKLAIKTPERHVVSGIFIANFEHISFVPVFPFLTLNKYLIIFITGHARPRDCFYFFSFKTFLFMACWNKKLFIIMFLYFNFS